MLTGVPKLASGTGQDQATAVVKCLDEWNLRPKVGGLCFDTTASNTGRLNGACTLIEHIMGRDLLHFACRHHIYEIVVEKIFTALKITAASSGPDISLFKRFKEQWSFIDQGTYETAAGMKEIESFQQQSIAFAESHLQLYQPRDDYREFLELVIIFLGGMPARGIHIIAPGALHAARWMARIIYCFKIWMFRSQFKLKLSEEQGMFTFLLFVSKIYLQAWFEAPNPVSAPANDLRFLQQLSMYEHHGVKEAAVVAFSRHLWYLSEVMIGLAFFDPNVELQEKEKMIRNLHEKEGSEELPHRLDAKFCYSDQPLSSFVTTKTKSFFTILQLPESYLSKPVETWSNDSEFQEAEQVVKSLTVVNDAAERGVKLIQDFNESLTNDEEQKQFLLQVIQEHRHLYPDTKKSTVMSGLCQK